MLLLFATSYVMSQPVIQGNLTYSNTTCNNNDGSISVAPTGGTAPYTYQWRVGISGPVFSNSSSVSGLAPNYYTVQISDINNFSVSDSVSIINSIIGYVYNNAPANCPQSNGSAEFVILQGGTAPFTYSWTNGATSSIATNLSGNTDISVEVTDANGCYVYFQNPVTYSYTNTVGTTHISSYSTITSNYTTTPEQCPLNNGTITLNPSAGTAPYTYYWNTTPVQTTQIATGLTAGTYSVSITDANGCSNIEYISVNLNPGSLNVTASVVNDVCTKLQGSATLNITGGIPPYIINWYDGSSANSKNGMGFGEYNVSVSDQNNCTFYKEIFIDDLSPVSTTINNTTSGCDNISGNALANASGGAAPYTYQWNTGAMTTSISNLSRGYYGVHVTDVNGCTANNWTFVDINSSCWAYISGTIFQDNNGDCVQNLGEYPIMNEWIYVHAATSSPYLYDSYTISNTNGAYTSGYVLPDQYTVANNDEIRASLCPNASLYNLNIPVSGVNYPGKDFAKFPSSLYEDVELLCFSEYSLPRPGFDYSYSIAYKNHGTVPSNGYIEVVYGDIESFVSSSPAADFYDPTTKTLRFNYSTLMLGEIRSININYHIPTSALLGSTYTHSVSAVIGGTDPTPLNNLATYYFTVVGSFDPNELTVSPDGNISKADSVLTYTIRFQNTGTYPAELVIIKDTLDVNLNIGTISNITSSNDVKFRVLENRVIEFAFENINLPDSTSDEKGSHGLVTFQITTNKNLVSGTQIKNKAGIYFDFNQPIITNVRVNTIAVETGISEKAITSSGNIYPNPAKDYTVFSFETEISSIQLMNVSGITLLNQPINNLTEFKLNFNLPKGMYFYKAIGKNGNPYSGKLMID
jgi:uncharacterized repeat protein (TIGR01451 family)